jgi:hypothetical protein
MHKRFALIAAISLTMLPLAAAAHHGWGWTQEQESRLAGTIQSISFGNPHMHLQLRNDQGTWEVDLSPPIVAQGSEAILRPKTRSPTSSRLNPLMARIEMRPARLSEDWRKRSGEALPRIKKRAGSGVRSTSTRSTGKRSGRREPRRRRSGGAGVRRMHY